MPESLHVILKSIERTYVLVFIEHIHFGWLGCQAVLCASIHLKVRLNKIVEHANSGNKNIYHKILNLFTQRCDFWEVWGILNLLLGRGRKAKE